MNRTRATEAARDGAERPTRRLAYSSRLPAPVMCRWRCGEPAAVEVLARHLSGPYCAADAEYLTGELRRKGLDDPVALPLG